MSLKYNLKNLNTNTYIYFNPSNAEKIDEIKTIIEMDDTLNFPNESDINDTYKNLSQLILRGKNVGFLCKGLTLEYIQDALDSADAIVAISSQGTNLLPNGNLFGFALINFDENDNSVNIDVICSHIGIKYAGDILINSINNICNKLFITKIKLNSVSSAISFYEKYGFIKKGLCENSNELCEMEKIVTKKSIGGKRKTLKRNLIKKIKKRRKNTKKRSLKYSRK
jgi:hypothetical protein